MNDDAWLRRAEEHIFLCGVGDAAEQLCRANLTYGLAKIHYAEEQLGHEPRASFIGAPDATVTRNTRRWRAGFGYGGQLRWDPALAVLDSRPNACGMLVGALEEAPDERAVRARAASLERCHPSLDGVELRPDLRESNHFVDAIELESVAAADPRSAPLPRHLFIIHASGHEHRGPSALGSGLYLEESEELRRLATPVATPWGTISVLQGDDARTYFELCHAVQAFNCRRRELLGELLFGPHRVLCNVTHQGIREAGVLHLGSYWSSPQSSELFPLTLGRDQPVYLVRPRPSFSPHIIERLGWSERAGRLGVLPCLEEANLLPHGGGYAFPELRRLQGVGSTGDERRFVLEPSAGAPLEIENARVLPFAFRGEAVLQRTLELELATVVARYRITFVV